VDTEQAPVAALNPPGFPACVIAGDAVSLSLFVAGTPVPKGRPRTRVVQPKNAGASAYAQIYTPHETVGWEDMVIIQVRQQLIGLTLTEPRLAQLEMPLSGRGLIALRFNLPRPKSLPKKILFPMKSKTDWDNLAKSVQDALQAGGLIQNDTMVTDATTAKRFAEPGHPIGVEIDLTVLR
jgi:Holliday junction resolvase RusA-like endonuclease